MSTFARVPVSIHIMVFMEISHMAVLTLVRHFLKTAALSYEYFGSTFLITAKMSCYTAFMWEMAVLVLCKYILLMMAEMSSYSAFMWMSHVAVLLYSKEKSLW